MNQARIRNTYDLRGVVQGVGFRPAMLRLARGMSLAGHVQNRTGSVSLTIEGAPSSIDSFMKALPDNLPANARIDSVILAESLSINGAEKLEDFSIHPSSQSGAAELLIPADLATCPDCMADITKPGNRRYRYPFTTCINCGPRYTIIHSTPYDRARTTMAVFPMCHACRREYENPSDRRFHAETIACHDCGPRILIEDASGNTLACDPLLKTRQELSAGKIIAVRGIGGFLLTADAFNRNTLMELRRRKTRPDKPFAVMAPDISTLARYCIVPAEAEQLLTSAASPIVILEVRPEPVAEGRLPLALLSPDTKTLGVMLPTSPLHAMLFTPLGLDNVPPFELLVMTSGNRGGEPTSITNTEARERLRGIFDFILLHNREINLRNDDSLCVISRGSPQVWRRARGFAPNPVRLSSPVSCNILAMGADMKNAITLAHDDYAVISPHTGDLETPESMDSIENISASLPAFLAKEPGAVAVDLHPDMLSTRLGRRIAATRHIPVIGVQHHHAHAVACLTDNGLENGLALVFDGTGQGTDGTIWGAELLAVAHEGFTRLATFSGVPLPGGDAAVRNPARQLVSRFMTCGTGITDEWKTRLGISETDVDSWGKQCLGRINTPVTHAAGRLLDSFSALLGMTPARISYEGQPAIRLEAAARRCRETSIPELPFTAQELDGKLFIDWNSAFAMLADTRVFAGRQELYAMAVHHAMAQAAVDMAEYGMNRSPVRTIALSGGVFMNGILNDLLIPRLEELGLKVVIHRNVPPNDGGISLGQAVIAGRSRR